MFFFKNIVFLIKSGKTFHQEMKGAGLLGSAGNILFSQLMDDGDEHTKRGIITYETREMAQTAIDRFHEVDYKVSALLA